MNVSPRRLRLVLLLIVGAAVLWQRFPLRHGTQGPPGKPIATASAPLTLKRGSLTLDACELNAPHSPAAPVAAYCADVTVPEDRTHPEGRRITLKVAVVPTTGEKPDRDAVTFLDGGPGGAALSDYPLVAGAFAPLRKSRDVLLVDQRGTGGSHAFKCKQGAETDTAARVRACSDAVSASADPRFYTTMDATADLDDVRQRLGYPTLTVVGVSYGTRVAQIYARDYPLAVRALVLDSPVPNALTLGSEHALNLDASLTARFAGCAADAACRTRFGDPMQTLHQLLATLTTHPVDVDIADPITHSARHERVTRASLAQLVRFYAYSPITSAVLPLTLDEARKGHYEPLLGQLLLVQGDLSTRLDGPMELSVLCSEDAPLLTERAEDVRTVLGSGFVKEAKIACGEWPHAPMPGNFHAPLKGAVPTLILVGEFDPVTPPRYAHDIAQHLSGARVVIMNGQGHSVMGTGCAPEVVRHFVESADSKTLDVTCLARERAAPFFLDYAGSAP